MWTKCFGFGIEIIVWSHGSPFFIRFSLGMQIGGLQLLDPSLDIVVLVATMHNLSVKFLSIYFDYL